MVSTLAIAQTQFINQSKKYHTMKKKKRKIPRKLSWVKFDFSGMDEQTYSDYAQIFNEEAYIFMGEITNMPGHCILLSPNGNTKIGYHTENFIELSEDEV